MKVSSLERTQHDRVTVHFDDGSSVSSTEGAVASMRLFAGKALEKDEADEFRLLSARFLALEKASGYLSARRMSSKELRLKLMRHGCSEDAADYCVQRLSGEGLLDDGEFSSAVVRKYASKGYGEARIKAELARRGVPAEIRSEALSAMPSPDEALDRLVASRLKDPGDRDEVRKVSAFLFRRGYSWEDIRSAIRRYTENSEFEDC